MTTVPPARITSALLRKWPLPEVDPTHGKVARGTVLVFGGSDRNAGAALLAGLGALRAGAGRLQIATAASAVPALSVAVPEARITALPTGRDGELSDRSWRAVITELSACDTVIVGPGVVRAGACAALVRAAARQAPELSWVLDGGALKAIDASMLAHLGPAAARTVITPHAGEMAKLRGIERAAVTRAPAAVARRAARELGVVVTLKGPRTFVVTPSGVTFEHRGGNPGLGTSGSGDVLAGVIGGLCARGASPEHAAAMGVLAHGRAGDALAKRIGPLGYLASELLAEIPRALAPR